MKQRVGHGFEECGGLAEATVALLKWPLAFTACRVVVLEAIMPSTDTALHPNIG